MKPWSNRRWKMATVSPCHPPGACPMWSHTVPTVAGRWNLIGANRRWKPNRASDGSVASADGTASKIPSAYLPPSIWAELIGYCSWCRVARLPGAASTLIKDRTREQRAGARPSASNQIRQRWGSDSKPISVAAPNYSNNHESIEKRKCYGPWLAATSSNVAKINRSRNQETRSTSTTGPKERSQGKERREERVHLSKATGSHLNWKPKSCPIAATRCTSTSRPAGGGGKEEDEKDPPR